MNNHPEQPSIFFASGLWLGGVDQGAKLRIAAQTYNSSGNDYWPGALAESPANISAVECENWDKIFTIEKADVDAFIADFEDNGILDDPIPASILGWPAKDNPQFFSIHNFTLPSGKELAPFFDRNADGVYRPVLDGDFPIAKGDKTLWWVVNDIGNTHTHSTGSVPFGMEIQMMAYAMNSSDEVLSNTICYECKFTYMDTTLIHDAYVGLWIDSDAWPFGCAPIDYFGTVPDEGIAYFYRPDKLEICNDTSPPVFSDSLVGIVKVLQSPKISIGADTQKHIIDVATYYGNNIYSPVLDLEYYNYLRGLWRDSFVLGTGTGGVIDTIKTAFDGTLINNTPWTMCNFPPASVDRRTLISFGPMDFQPGQTRQMALAFIHSPGHHYPCPDVNEIIDVGDKIEAFYKDNISLSTQPLLASNLIVSPNPTSGIFSIVTDQMISHVDIYAINGQLLRSFSSIRSGDQLNISSFGSGMYLCKIELANGAFVVRKIVLLY